MLVWVLLQRPAAAALAEADANHVQAAVDVLCNICGRDAAFSPQAAEAGTVDALEYSLSARNADIGDHAAIALACTALKDVLEAAAYAPLLHRADDLMRNATVKETARRQRTNYYRV